MTSVRQSFADSSAVGGQTLPLAMIGSRVWRMLSQLQDDVVVVAVVVFAFGTFTAAASVDLICWVDVSTCRRSISTSGGVICWIGRLDLLLVVPIVSAAAILW